MALNDLLNKARRRLINQLLLDKGALALTIGMGGGILLLLAGTDILDWYWPGLLLIASLSFGVYQLRKHIPSMYDLAQRIDQRLALADTLSTAVHFLAHPVKGAESVAELQRQGAEHAAQSVNVELAVPYTRSRYLAPAAGLLLVALGLFAVRYAVIGNLDLRSSLLQMAAEEFLYTPEERVEAAKLRAELHPEAFKPSDQDAPPTTGELETPPDGKDGSELTKGDDDAKAGQAKDKNGDPLDKESDKDGKSGDDSEKNDSGSDKGDKQGQEKQNEGKEGQQNSQQSKADERSMLDKLRDAVSNLVNQMTSDPGKQDSKGDKGKQESAKGNDQQKGDASAEDAQGNAKKDSGKGDAKDSQQAKESQGPGEKSGPGSGMGSDEGNKELLKEAELLEAMGKVSELLGQRAEQVTGGMMVEVGTTKQQLRTAFTQQQAGKSQTGSEIHRDEVPLMYQQYVERYFTEIRKGEIQSAGKNKGAVQSKPGGPTPAK